MAVLTSSYPTSVDTTSTLGEVSNRAKTALVDALSDSGETQISLSDASLFPTTGAITIDSEIFYYSNKSGNVLTIESRGQQGTISASHSSGALVYLRFTKGHWEVFKNSVISLETKLGVTSSTPTENTWLKGTGTGISEWSSISSADVGLSNVENTALSTWTGSTSLTTIGTLTNLTQTGYHDLSTISTPASPSSSTVRLYAVDDNSVTRLQYKLPDGTVVQIARDNIYVVRNTEGSTLSAGDVVYISGGQGISGTAEVKKARANSNTTMPAFAYVMESINNNSYGRVMSSGKLDNINTSAFSEGEILWVSDSTAGALTATKPVHPNLQQRFGVVVNSHASQGTLLISPVGVRGDNDGTNQNTWKIGDGASGAKTIGFQNGSLGTLSWNPTGTRTLTLPDTTGIIALTSDLSGYITDASVNTLTNKNLTSGTNTFPTFNQNTTGSAATLTTSRTIGGVSFNGSANITVASATGGFTVSGGNLALGTNSLTMTGSLAATGARVTKGWFTDIESTNMITVGGTSLSTTFSPAAGSASITTLGTIGTGTWQGSVIGSTYGGTGVNNAGRTLTINTNSGTISFTTSVTLTVAATASVSGTNTGDQTITLTSDVTGTGTGSFATTIASGAVSLAKMANLAANSVIGNSTGGSATPTAVSMVTTATASSVLLRNSNANALANNFLSNYTSTATAAGTTTLTVSSSRFQNFTGTTTQTVTLPVVSTLALGHTFEITNYSTGIVTVQSSGANSIQAMAANSRLIVTSNTTSGTGATVWNSSYTPILTNVENTALSTWAGSTSLTTLGTIGAGTWQGSVIGSTYGGTGVNNAGRTLTINTNSGTVAFSSSSLTLTVAATSSISGTNTGDQTITLTSDVTGTGTGSFATTIATNAVTYAKMQQASAGFAIMAKVGTGSGNYAELTAGTDSILMRSGSGNLTFGTIVTNHIGATAVTYAKIQDVGANSILGRVAGTSGVLSAISIGASQLFGRGSTGDIAAITLGTNLSMSGTTLNATGSGSVTVGGAISGGTNNTVLYKDSSGNLGSNSNLGWDATTFDVGGLVRVTRTSEQLRLRYDASNYWVASTDSVGGTNFTAFGSSASFRFSSATQFFDGSNGISWIPFTDGNIYLSSNNIILRNGSNVELGRLDSTGLNVRPKSRVTSTASSSTPTPSADNEETFILTALAVGATFGVPTGTPTNAQKLLIRIKDNGTARSLTWNSIYRAIGVTLPTTTTINKTLYVGFVYNSTDTKWDCVSVALEA